MSKYINVDVQIEAPTSRWRVVANMLASATREAGTARVYADEIIDACEKAEHGSYLYLGGGNDGKKK